MAKKFFNQKVSNKKKTITQIIIISICVIGIVACLLIVNYFNKKIPKDAVIELRDSVAVEVNGQIPDKTVFFTKLEQIDEENISINFDNVDLKKVGDYELEVKIYNKKYKTVLKVVDTISPVLEIKNVTIDEGDTYTVQDFVNSCTDNSNEECIIEFYTLATTQEGEKIDYASYTENGTYPIQIIAKDATGNQTAPLSTTLIIGTGKEETSEPKCKFGTDEYNTDENILAVSVSENGCAIDPALYNNESILQAIKNFGDIESQKIKNEFKKLNIPGTMYLDLNQLPISNSEGEGFVGYGLEITLKNDSNEIIEQYHVKTDGTRIYSINKYNLP